MLPRFWFGVAAVTALIAALGASPVPASQPDDERTIAHVLNRIGFGARPGDVEKVAAIGARRYIEQQLHPERIADAALAQRLAHLETVQLSGVDIIERFERPLVAARRLQPAPPPPAQRGGTSANAEMMTPPARPNPAAQAANSLVIELTEQKLLRAIYSERQLEEVLADFWFNHFNVDSRKGRVRFMLTEYERDAIRPHVLGSFRDLLGATAKSPAMLFYLDNFMSAGPTTPLLRRPRPGMRPGRGRALPPPQPAPAAAAPRAPRGLNENYGRELLELHTLGVDGGYTQRDVTEVARAFTGWTIAPAAQGSGFRFEPRMHDEGEKLVLGHRLTAGGQRDGEQVLDLLASHPSTARFIATKLARRFVSDTPPAALVERAAARFRATDGDLREVVRTILLSAEFMAPEAIRAKTKTPFEFVVSGVRTTGIPVADPRTLGRGLQQMGMPLYQCQPPTGYKDTADAWTSTGALITRMNFALTLARQNPGVPRVSVDDLLHGEVSEATRTTIARAATPAQALALALGSPEFQKR
jgi:uncharacterized protein (DUF1800 family)